MKNKVIQYLSGDVWYASGDHLVWVSDDAGMTWREVCRLSDAGKSLLSCCLSKILRTAQIQILRRNIGINNLVILPSGTIIAQYDKIYRCANNGGKATPVFDLAAHGLDGPLKNGLCYDEATSALYFGEYRCERPSSIAIVKGCDDGRRWEVCHRFQKGEIRHVHAVVSDPYRRRIWVCTGDADEESWLWYTEDGFRSIQRFAGGDQSWRMVGLLPLPNAILWGSDAGGDADADATNGIYRYDFEAHSRQKLFECINPIYFSMQAKEGYLFSTAYEPHKQNAEPKAAELLFSRDGIIWESVVQLPYKEAPGKTWTRYGMIVLPQGGGGQIVFTPLNTESNHFCVMVMHKEGGNAGTR